MSVETLPTSTELAKQHIALYEQGSADPHGDYKRLEELQTVESLKDGPIPLENKLGEAALGANEPILGTESQADMDHWTTTSK